MKKFLIFKKLEDGYYGEKLGSYESEFKDDTSANRSYLMAEPMASHFELPEELDEDIVKLVLIPEQEIITNSSNPDSKQVIPSHWKLQEDEDLRNHKVQSLKEKRIEEAYFKMSKEIYEEMEIVFGTKNSDSAIAYEKTWNLMLANSEEWSNLGLKDDVNDLLDTSEKVLDFASKKISQVVIYGKWRMQRIAQFRQERENILNE
jgi:hypothetical protein